MPPKEWAKVCGTSRATFALRRSLIAAEICVEPGNDDQVLLSQLQHEKQPTCHSLFLNLQQTQEDVVLSPAQISQVIAAGSNLPVLKCLHIIGREGVPLTESSIEGVLVRLLAKHASLLTLQVKTVLTFPNLPNLQHLVLDVGNFPGGGMDRQNNAALFPAISMLKGLKTLYLQSAEENMIFEPANLSGCVHLQHVALQGVCLEGAVSLPGGCHLHVKNIPEHLSGVTPTTFDLITGMTLRHASGSDLLGIHHGMDFRRAGAPVMSNLKRLRVTLNREDLDFHFWLSASDDERLELSFHPGTTPCCARVTTLGDARAGCVLQCCDLHRPLGSAEVAGTHSGRCLASGSSDVGPDFKGPAQGVVSSVKQGFFALLWGAAGGHPCQGVMGRVVAESCEARVGILVSLHASWICSLQPAGVLL